MLLGRRDPISRQEAAASQAGRANSIEVMRPAGRAGGRGKVVSGRQLHFGAEMPAGCAIDLGAVH